MVQRVTAGWNVRLLFEPGRVIAGNAGVLLSKVIRIKQGATQPFVIVDAAMNDLVRPAMYEAWHDIRAVRPRNSQITASVVGPICETGDTFAMGGRWMRFRLTILSPSPPPGPMVRIWPHTYNSRPLVPEVLVEATNGQLSPPADRARNIPRRRARAGLAAMIDNLPLFHRIAGRPVIVLGEGEAA